MTSIPNPPEIHELPYPLSELIAFYPNSGQITHLLAGNMIETIRTHRERDEWVREIGEYLHAMAQGRETVRAETVYEVGKILAMAMR